MLYLFFVKFCDTAIQSAESPNPLSFLLKVETLIYFFFFQF
jgi:hypothetical protein